MRRTWSPPGESPLRYYTLPTDCNVADLWEFFWSPESELMAAECRTAAESEQVRALDDITFIHEDIVTLRQDKSTNVQLFTVALNHSHEADPDHVALVADLRHIVMLRERQSAADRVRTHRALSAGSLTSPSSVRVTGRTSSRERRAALAAAGEQVGVDQDTAGIGSRTSTVTPIQTISSPPPKDMTAISENSQLALSSPPHPSAASSGEFTERAPRPRLLIPQRTSRKKFPRQDSGVAHMFDYEDEYYILSQWARGFTLKTIHDGLVGEHNYLERNAHWTLYEMLIFFIKSTSAWTNFDYVSYADWQWPGWRQHFTLPKLLAMQANVDWFDQTVIPVARAARVVEDSLQTVAQVVPESPGTLQAREETPEPAQVVDGDVEEEGRSEIEIQIDRALEDMGAPRDEVSNSHDDEHEDNEMSSPLDESKYDETQDGTGTELDDNDQWDFGEEHSDEER